MLKDKDFISEQREWYADSHDNTDVTDREIVEWYMDGTSYDVMYPEELQDILHEEDDE